MNDLFGGRNTTIDTNPKPVSWNAWWTKYAPPNLTDDLWDLIEETFEEIKDGD
jgi:hypothetical protein